MAKQHEEQPNVVLLPRTIDYYQEELTRMLETDRYVEAAQTLRFLLGCQSGDPKTDAEWTALLQWLEQAMPDLLAHASGDYDGEESEMTEEALLQARLQERQQADAAYGANRLAELQQEPELARQLELLDLLIYAGPSETNDRLLAWLQAPARHPFAQFKALQALRKRGMTGQVELVRGQDRLRLEIDGVPLVFTDFPDAVQAIMVHMQRVCEQANPMLIAFGEQTWREFLSFRYGEPVYHRVTRLSGMEQRAWAAALHQATERHLFDKLDGAESELLERYGLSPQGHQSYEEAKRQMEAFVLAAYPRL